MCPLLPLQNSQAATTARGGGVVRSICYLSSICAPYREYRKPWKDTGNVFPRLFDDRDRKGYLFYHLISTLLQTDTDTVQGSVKNFLQIGLQVPV